MTVELALGTYRCRNPWNVAPNGLRDQTLRWIDTAPNYRNEDGALEPQVGRALERYPEAQVSTKVGYFSGTTANDALLQGIITEADAKAHHSLAPAYITWQVTRSRRLLQRRPDIVFVHNPEARISDASQIHTRLRAAFEALEGCCRDGLIASYGVATWHALHDGSLTVRQVLDAARDVAGERHNLRAIQLPLSLVMSGPLVDATKGHGALIDAELGGLDVFASSPLHGGELIAAVSARAAFEVLPGRTPLHLMLGILAASPIKRVLLSTASWAHWMDAYETLNGPPMSPEELRSVLDAFSGS